MTPSPTLVKVGLLLASAIVSSVLVYIGLLLATGQEPFGSVRSLVAPPGEAANLAKLTRIGIWRDDARLGYAHVPLATGRHRKVAEFDVHYSIDATGCRVTPDPAGSRGVVLVLGDSFTFGHGVADTEAYPAVLGARHWPMYKVRNCAGMGWGTGQAALIVDDALGRSPKPTVMIYGWIWPDAHRNYLRRSWLRKLSAINRRNVHFEVVGDRLRHEGTAGLELAMDDHTPELPGKERALTLALVGHMADAAAEASVAFYVVLLPYGNPAESIPINEDLVDFLRRRSIAFVDLRRLASNASPGPLSLDGTAFFPRDGHPRPAWHVAVAGAITAAIPLK